jgi:putative tryptophan/tyrosine transport system substrate-binding protein
VLELRGRSRRAQQTGKLPTIGILGVNSSVWGPWTVVSDTLMAASRTRIVTFALSARLPTIFSYRDYVKAGGLMSYGPDFTDLFRRAADIVDKILHGTNPGDVPVEQPTKFEFVLNLTKTKALGLTIPASFLALADDLME